MAEIDRRKAELIAELEVSRGEMRTAMRRVELSADVLERVRHHVGQHIGGWILGGLASGFLLARLSLPRRQPAQTRPASVNTPEYSQSTSDSAEFFGQSEVSDRRSGPKSDSGGVKTFLFSAARFAFDLARPKLTEWAGAKLGELLTSVLEKTQAPPSTAAPNPPAASHASAEPLSNR